MENYSGNALLTASRSAVKDSAAIEAAVSQGKGRLVKLERLSRIRRR